MHITGFFRVLGCALGLFMGGTGLLFSISAAVTTHCIFSSNMVLQRDIPVPVWGWADPGQQVSVSFAGQTVSGTTDGEGRWKAVLSAMAAGGPHTMTVAGGTTTLIYANVMVGDVWVTGGQSNMEITFLAGAGVDPAKAPKEDVPNMRLFRLQFNHSRNPVDDAKTIDSLLIYTSRINANGSWNAGSYVASSPWRPMTAANAIRCSQVGYWFGRKVHNTLGISVGLIDNSAGGTRISQWYSSISKKTTFVLQDTTDLKVLKYTNEAQAEQLGNTIQSGYFNGSVYPIMGFPIRGVIWWQGESDCHFGYNSNYGAEHIETIKQWRNGPTCLTNPPAGTPQRVLDHLSRWKKGFGIGDFFWIYFELQGGCDTVNFHKMQRQALALPNVGGISVPGVSGDHPEQKWRQPIGEAFADKALAMMAGTLNRGKAHSSPVASAPFRAGVLSCGTCRVTGYLSKAGSVVVSLSDLSGRKLATHFAGIRDAGALDIVYQSPLHAPGIGIISVSVDGIEVASMTGSLGLGGGRIRPESGH